MSDTPDDESEAKEEPALSALLKKSLSADVEKEHGERLTTPGQRVAERGAGGALVGVGEGRDHRRGRVAS